MAAIPVIKPVIGAAEEEAVVEVLRSGWLTQGSRVAKFEEVFAAYVGAPHAVAVSSCTTALHAILVALGIGPGDEVICPSLSFIASANVVRHAGAQPVFADIEERTFNLDPAAVAAAITGRTRAIMAVHQVGLPVDLTALTELARDRGLHLIEDAACAIGSLYRGERIGRPHGVAAAFSFHPRKLLTTGEGGMITTADGALAAHLRRLRHHGMTISDVERHRTTDRYLHESYAEVGFNYRMTDLQAAVGIVQLGRIEDILTRRRALAARYTKLLEGLSGVEPPLAPEGHVTNFQSYIVRLHGIGRAGRDRVLDRLMRREVSARPGIMTAHREPPYREQAARLPVTEQVSDETLILPLYHQMTEADQDRVLEALREAMAAT